MATSIAAHPSSTAAPSGAFAPGPFALAPAPLLVLAQDDKFLELIRRCSEGRALRIAGSEIDFSAALLQDHNGVALLDCAALASAVEALTARIKAQFPELVLVVAGGSAEQAVLSAQIADGSVHRFLHKPLSEQRLRLFLDAAWRRHAERRPLAGAPSVPRRRRSLKLLLLLALLACGAFLAYTQWPSAPQPVYRPAAAPRPPPVATDSELERLLQAADAALSAGKLAGEPQSAAPLYAAALARSPHEPRASAGLEQVVTHLAAAAEVQLRERRLDVAQQLIEAARAVQPDHPRIAFVAAQLDAQRERAVLSKAQHAAAGGDVAAALAVLEGASRDGHGSPLVNEARAQLVQQQLEARVGEFLASARSAADSGALLAPVEHNARFYVESALALASADPKALAARSELAARMQTQAEQSVAAGNADEADTYASAAADLGAASGAVGALHAAADKLRVNARAAARARSEGLFQQRLAQGRLVEPAGDSAKDYLQQIAQSDTPAEAQEARSAFAARLVDAARGALQAQDPTSARRWLAEARSAGASPTEMATLEGLLPSQAAAAPPAAPAPTVVNANSLQRLRYLAPVYPAAAQSRGLEGWVDLQFRVQADGAVADVSIVAAQPVGIFENAALEAVRHWRYEPQRRDGQAVAQQARVRVRFTEHP
ncbi:MAG: TonB family protein [Gammaproteobacteria bacterium]|nr:TonB family protein [Gammaproteobacteria bacterium]